VKSKYGGYMGRVVRLDLSTEKVTEYPWTDRDRELYIGGKIMASKILLDHLTGKEEAYSEENWIVISTGPLTGTGAPSSARFNISGVSPQTGIVASSNCGGDFGYYLKRAGYDALILSGRCRERSWVEIREDSFVFHSAEELWGMKTSRTQRAIEEKMDVNGRLGMIVIGPAGENLVKYSSIMSGERAAGRTGLGSVLGWKNLKGIAVTGSKTVPVHDREKTTKLCREWFSYLKNHPITGKQMPGMGTAGLVSPMEARGLLATENYSSGRFEDFDSVSGETLTEEYLVKNQGCFSCPIRCGRTVKVKGQNVKGPELETLGLLGGGIRNSSMQNIMDWNYELDELGMDTISTANTIAWAMEANEKGLWDCGLSFGRTEGLTQVFDDIAYRRGIGDELAEGSKRLSEKYGGKDFAMHSKGLELAAYEPRRAVGQGLGYAVSNRGGCHLNGGYLVILEGLGLDVDPQTPKGKADFTMLFQDLMEAISGAGQCLFTSYGVLPAFLVEKPSSSVARAVNWSIPHLGWAVRIVNRFPGMLCFNLPFIQHSSMIKYATGMKMNLGRLIRIGERGYDTERWIDTKFGITAKNDSLPKRLTHVPQDPGDPTTVVPLERMKKTYYRARGWTKDGIPKESTLRRLKII
jgi:aldehyde:ferredoxin oxidoreductase